MPTLYKNHADGTWIEIREPSPGPAVKAGASTVALGGGSSTTIDAKGLIVARIARLGAVDLGSDVTEPGSVGSQPVTIGAFNHASNLPGHLPVGEGTVNEEQGWLLLRGRLFMDTIAGRETYLTLRGLGPKAEYSWSYLTLDSAPGVRDGQRVRRLLKLLIFEVSPVMRGMNVGTGTISLSGVDPLQIEVARVVHDLDRALADDRGWARPRRDLLGRHPVDGSPIFLSDGGRK